MSQLPITTVGAGDQGSFGTASVGNVAQGVFPVGLPPTKPPLPIVHRPSKAGQLAIPLTAPVAPLPATAVRVQFGGATVQSGITLGDTAAVGKAVVSNAAHGVYPSAIPPPRMPGVYAYLKVQGIPVDLVFTTPLTAWTAQNVPLRFGGAFVVQPVGVGDTSSFGRIEKVEQTYSVLPPGVAPGRVGVPGIADASRTGSAVAIEFLGAVGSHADGNVRIDFDPTKRPVSGVGAGDTTQFGATSIVNSAFGVYPEGMPPPRATKPFVYNYVWRSGKVDIPLGQGLGTWSPLNVPFYFNDAIGFSPRTWQSSSFGLPFIEGGAGVTTVTAYGFTSSTVGLHSIDRHHATILPGGIAALNKQVPAPYIGDRVQRINGILGIPAAGIPTNHIFTHWVQEVDLRTRGVYSQAVGSPTVTFKYREVYPTSTGGSVFGTHEMRRVVAVYPDGWDSSFLSHNAELLVNTQRILHATGEADPAQYGVPLVGNWVQTVDLHNFGWLDTSWNTPPVVFNLTRYVTVGPFGENIAPEQWPNYSPTVENVDREVRTFGHSSLRMGLSTWVRNSADSVSPAGIDSCVFGEDTQVTHGVRSLLLTGWESSYSDRYGVVRNVAVLVRPNSLGDTSLFGRPDPVANLNRSVVHHTPWPGETMGVAYIDFAVREVYPKIFIDVPASFPEVRHNPHPIAPVGIPPLGQVGGHTTYTYRATILPKSVNVHSNEWVGEPVVKNRNITTKTFGRDTSEFGRAEVHNYIRYIYPDGYNGEEFSLSYIGRRTRVLVAYSIAPPRIVDTHAVGKAIPDPPATQIILLSVEKAEGVQLGLGIEPPEMPAPEFLLATLYPESIFRGSPFGKPIIYSTSLHVRGWFNPSEFGRPTLANTTVVYVHVKSLEGESEVSKKARLSPWHIYAPLGDSKPPGYTAIGGEGDPTVINSEVKFGDHSVSNRHRTIGPVPKRYIGDVMDGFDYFPKFGDAAFTLRLQYVRVPGIRSLRFGLARLWGVPQYINLDDPYNRAGIRSSTKWGVLVISPPYVPPLLDQQIFVRGADSFEGGEATVELFNRSVYPSAIPHRGNPESPDPYKTNPWGVPMIGYPRKYSVGMGVQTVWGRATIEFKNRAVAVAGWLSCSLEDDNFENFLHPMRVYRRNVSTNVPSIQRGERVGRPAISHAFRGVQTRGTTSSVVGTPAIRPVSKILVAGFYSTEFGDIDRWEAGKIKSAGTDSLAFGRAAVQYVTYPDTIESGGVPVPSVASAISPVGIPDIGFSGPLVTNPFGCHSRIVSPLPILPATGVGLHTVH